MTKEQAFKKFTFYLKKNNIKYYDNSDDEILQLTIVYNKGMDLCPDGILESSVFFWKDCAEVRVHYDKNAAGWCENYKENHPDLFRFFNYLAAELWPKGADFCGGELYKPENLYNPRIYMTEDGRYDITLTFNVNYDFYDIAPIETADYITACCPDVMNRLSPAIFGVLLGNRNVDNAIEYVKNTFG